MARSRHMNPEELRFSEQQLQQLRATRRRLRRLNRTVLMHLRQIGPHFSDKQYRDAGKLLGIEASQMNSLLGFRKQIIEAGRRREAEEMVGTIEWVCRACPENIPLGVPEAELARLPEGLVPGPVWQCEK